MAIEFPADPSTQTPANTFSPTSTPLASPNDVTYTWDGVKWEAYKVLDPNDFENIFVEVAGDDMSGNLTLGTDKIVLNAGDGSAQFAGPVQTISLRQTASGTTNIYKQTANPTEPIFGVASDINGTQYRHALFTADGSLSIGGDVGTSPLIQL